MFFGLLIDILHIWIAYSVLWVNLSSWKGYNRNYEDSKFVLPMVDYSWLYPIIYQNINFESIYIQRFILFQISNMFTRQKVLGTFLFWPDVTLSSTIPNRYWRNNRKFMASDTINKGNNILLNTNKSTIQIQYIKIQLTKQVLHHRKNWYRNGPDLVQAFQKKWWVESRFYGAPNLPLPLRCK